MAADLSRTARGRELYDDIQAGNVTSMSLRCTVDSDFDYDNSTHIVKRVKKLYDVSAVSIPANDFTSIVARKQGMENDIEQMKNKKTKDMIELMIMLER